MSRPQGQAQLGPAGRPRPIRSQQNKSNSQHSYGQTSTPYNLDEDGKLYETYSDNDLDGKVQTRGPKNVESAERWSSNRRAGSNVSLSNSRASRAPQSAMLYHQHPTGGPIAPSSFHHPRLSPNSEHHREKQNRTHGPVAADRDHQQVYQEQQYALEREQEERFFMQQHYHNMTSWHDHQQYQQPPQLAVYPGQHGMMKGGRGFSESSSEESVSNRQCRRPQRTQQSEGKEIEQLVFIQPRDNARQFVSQKQIGMNPPERRQQMAMQYREPMQGYPAPTQYRLMKPMEEGRNYQVYSTNADMPDEFHHNEYIQQQFGRYEEQPDLDGYNDYGGSNGSRTDMQFSDCPGSHSVRQGARTAGYRPDVQLNGPQQWTMSERGAGSKQDDRSSHAHLSNRDLDRHPSGPRYGPPNNMNGKNDSHSNHSRIEKIRKLPTSQKSPTGQGSKQNLKHGAGAKLNVRHQANTARFNPNGGLMDDLSSNSLSECNTYFYTNQNSSHPHEDHMVTNLKQKFMTTQQSKLQTMGKVSPEPVTEPLKTNTGRVTAMQMMDSSLQPTNNTSEKNEPQSMKNQRGGHIQKICAVRESPGRRSDLARSSKPGQARHRQESARGTPADGKNRAAPFVMKADDAQNQRVSPYKLIMFGEKDMFYKNASRHNKPAAEIRPYQQDSPFEALEDHQEDNFEPDQGSMNSTMRRPSKGHSNYINVQQNEFETGSSLTPLEHSSRNGNKLSDKFQSATTTHAKIQSNLTSQPRLVFDTESNAAKHDECARTESREGTVNRNPPLTSESSRILTVECQQFNIEPERDTPMSGPDDHKDSNNTYLKYRPKTQRYQQSNDLQFPIITEIDETCEGQNVKLTDETVSEKNQRSQGRNRPLNSGARLTDSSQLQALPSSADTKREAHRKDVKNYVDSAYEDGMDFVPAPKVTMVSEKKLVNPCKTESKEKDWVPMSSQELEECEPKSDEYINLPHKTRNANLPVAVNRAYNISNHFGSTNEVITNGDNDQVLITLNHRNTNSGQQTARSSAGRRASQPSSRPTSKPLSRKLSLADVSQAPPPQINQPFESPKEVQKIVFTQQSKVMVVLEPSCIEEFRESGEQTHQMPSAEPDLISEPDTPFQHQIKTTEESPRPAVAEPSDSLEQLNPQPAKDGDYWDSLCSIPEEYPSQTENEDGSSKKARLKAEEQPREAEASKNEIKVPVPAQPSVFITDSVLTQMQRNEMKYKMNDIGLHLKYPTPEDRELMPAAKSSAAQKSTETRGQADGSGTSKLDHDKHVFKTDAKDVKGKTSPQPRKLQKQTSLKSFHTFDPEGSQKRLQNLSNQSKVSADSNYMNINLNEIVESDQIDSNQQALNGTIDDVAAENTIPDQNNTQDDMRVMTQEEYYQMKKEQIEDIYLGTEIIYEEDMENHEFSTLQTCQSATRLILPNQFNNMNFEGNTSAISPMKRSSKGVMSPESRKSWQITNSLEKQATGTKTSQKFENSGAKESGSNPTAVSRINNLRKKYSVDQQEAKPQLNKVHAAGEQKSSHRSQLTMNQPILTKQVVLQNPMGPFIPSSNLRQKLPLHQQAVELAKSGRTGVPGGAKDGSHRQDSTPQTFPMSMKEKQRAVSPLILVVNPAMTHHPLSGGHQAHVNVPKSARNTTKTFQNQFKPKAGGSGSVSKQRPKQSPHQRPYTSNGVMKHGVNHPRPSITYDSKGGLSNPHSPQQSKKSMAAKSFQGTKRSERKYDALAEHAYHPAATPQQAQVLHYDREKPLVKKYKKLTQHDSYLATLDSKAYQRPKALVDSHKLSWKKFLQHKKSQQHTHSHIQLNNTSQIEQQSQTDKSSQTLEKMSSQKLCQTKNYELKTGQINLLGDNNSSNKSLDKTNDKKSGDHSVEENKAELYTSNNQHSSLCARHGSEQPEETLIESGLSLGLGGNRHEDASLQTVQDQMLPRMPSYTTQNALSTQKQSQLPSSETISPRKFSPIKNKEDTAPSFKRPLVPKLKLSKMQMYKGVPRTLMTPPASSKSGGYVHGNLLGMKAVNQRQQATARQLNFYQSNSGNNNESSAEQIKQKMIKQQLSLPHVQQKAKNMIKMGAKERKWVQGVKQAQNNNVSQRKTTNNNAERKKPRHAEVNLVSSSPSPTHMNSYSAQQAKQSGPGNPRNQLELRNAPRYAQRLSIPVERTREIERVEPFHQESQEVEDFVIVPEAASSPGQQNTFEQERNQLSDAFKRASDEHSRQEPFNENLFERTGEDHSNERKLSTADEFKKNHMLKVSPLQQIKLSAKNLADFGDLNCDGLIILSTNSDQRVPSRKSFPNTVKGSITDRSKNGSSKDPSVILRSKRNGHSGAHSKDTSRVHSEKSGKSRNSYPLHKASHTVETPAIIEDHRHYNTLISSDAPPDTDAIGCNDTKQSRLADHTHPPPHRYRTSDDIK